MIVAATQPDLNQLVGKLFPPTYTLEFSENLLLASVEQLQQVVLDLEVAVRKWNAHNLQTLGVLGIVWLMTQQGLYMKHVKLFAGYLI